MCAILLPWHRTVGHICAEHMARRPGIYGAAPLLGLAWDMQGWLEQAPGAPQCPNQKLQ